VIAALTAMLGILKGLPLGYQRDLQEDKPPLFGAVQTYERSLRVLAGLVATLTIDRERMAAAAEEGFTTATALADALVRRGVPFRTAHHVVGSLVAHAESAGIARLADVPPDALLERLAVTEDDVARSLGAAGTATATELLGAASVERSLASADVIGGTAPDRVTAAIRAARARLDDAPRP
jgi:argininosuccinate lyase